MKKVIVSGIVLVAVAIGVAKFRRVFDPACVRLEAKVSLAKDFCEGLADRAAKGRCAAMIPEEAGEDNMNACVSFFRPIAIANCAETLNYEGLVRTYEEACR